MIEVERIATMSAAEYVGIAHWAHDAACRLGADPLRDTPLGGVSAIKAATAVLRLAVEDAPDTPKTPERDAAIAGLTDVVLELARVYSAGI